MADEAEIGIQRDVSADSSGSASPSNGSGHKNGGLKSGMKRGSDQSGNGLQPPLAEVKRERSNLSFAPDDEIVEVER